jgi:Domain of unknown function (DUF4129)
MRALALTAVLLGLLAVVALAAGGRTPIGGEAGESRKPPVVFWDYVFSTAAVLFLLAAPVAAWLFWLSRSSRDPQAGQRRDLRVLLFAAAVCAAIVLGSYFVRDRDGAQLPAVPMLPEVGAGGDVDEAGRRSPEFRPLPALIIGTAAVLLLAYYDARRRYRRSLALEQSEDALVDELSALLEDTLDDLRREPDPRRAVIAAYARMERALGAFGFPRRAFEAPLEYLERLAPELEELPGAARLVFELTHLYERAKFSAHAIDAGMKEDAIDTLLALRAELLEAA